MAIKTIGPQGAGVIHLTPAVHRTLRVLASKIATKEYGPQIAVDRAQLQTIRRQRKTDVRSVRGATNLAQKQIARAQHTLGASGLKGQYRAEVASELGARAADIASSEPGLAATVRGQYASDIAGAKNTILGDRAQIASETARNFYSLLSEAKTQARSTVARRRSRRQAQKPTPTQARAARQKRRQAKHGLHAAVQEAISLLTSAQPQPATSTHPAIPNPIPVTDSEWANFAQALLSKEGVNNIHQANYAVRYIRSHKRLLAHIYEQVGVSSLHFS